MKKYVILPYVVGNMGGGQMYCLNKLTYCKKMGYQTFVFPAKYLEKVYIDELKKYNNNIKSELSFSPSCFSKKHVQFMIDWFIKEIDYHEYDEVIIESLTIQSAQWGELFAQKIHGINLVFILSEHINSYNTVERNFLRFKYSVNQFACIKKNVMHDLFPDISEDQCIALGAVCSNTVQDVPLKKEFIDIGTRGYTIGILGRLRKPYVYYSLKSVCDFAEKNKNIKFEVIVIGGSSDESDYSKLKEAVNGCDNIELIFTDTLYPIPKKLLSKLKLCISAAGSARSVCQFVPTMSLDIYDMKAIGVLGYDTQETLISTASKKSIEDYLHLIICDHYLEEKEFHIGFSSYDEKQVENTLSQHFEFIELSRSNDKYYSFTRKCRKDIIGRIIFSIGGIKLLTMLRDKRRRVKKNGK